MVAPETLDTIEKTIDVIDETLDTIERIPRADLNGTTKKQQWIILGVTSGVSAVLGGLGSYYFFKRRFEKFFQLYYEEISNKEIEEAKKYYAARNKRAEFADPTKLLEKIQSEEAEKKNEFSDTVYEGKVGALKYSVEAPADTEKELSGPAARAENIVNLVEKGVKQAQAKAKEKGAPVIVQNVFTTETGPIGDFDYDVEVPKRTRETPYVLHHDEFYEGERDYTQVTLTFYEDDSVLVDDRDQPVADSEATVGDENLSRFGYGSQDPNIIYVRNERLEIDFEIARSNGSYVKEVLGFTEAEPDDHKSGR